MSGEHAGRTYLVTGGSAGIGLGAAQVLARQGARLVLVGRDRARLDAAIDRIDGTAIACPGDLADPAMPSTAINTALERFGALNGALVSSGGPGFGSVLTLSDDDWRQAFESTFLGVIRLCRELIPVLGPSSAIAVVLSTTVWEPIRGLAASNGLRPGLAMALTDLADEVGPRGVRVLGLAPGRIATERMGILAGGHHSGSDPEVPLQRWGTPEEFGEVAAFVLSERAAYLTGTVIAVDGGLHRSL